MRAARYLNQRINRQVAREDVDLVEGVQAGLGSRSYNVGQLSRRESRVRQFHDLIRARIPLSACRVEPGLHPPGRLHRLEQVLIKRK